MARDGRSPLPPDLMGSLFTCIIRQQGTTGAEAIYDSFCCNTPAEGKKILAEKLAGLKDGKILTLSGLVPAEVQIFRAMADHF